MQGCTGDEKVNRNLCFLMKIQNSFLMIGNEHTLSIQNLLKQKKTLLRNYLAALFHKFLHINYLFNPNNFFIDNLPIYGKS